MTHFKSLILAGCALIVGASSVAIAADTKSNLPFTDAQRPAMEEFIKNYILEHPEILIEAVNRHRTNEEKKKEEEATKALKDNMSFLNNSKHPVIGNPKGDITVVEFFDYNCGYCKHALKAVQELTEKDKNVKVVFLEYPILSEQSNEASKWAVAANMQGKYWEFHQAALESSAPKDSANLEKIAQSVGMDIEKAKKDAASDEVKTYLSSIKDFGGKLQVTGTPGFIIGDEMVRGFVEYPAFQTIVDAQRKKAK